MRNEFIPPVSIEEFAAYLDGNLSQEDMAKMELIIETDSSMQEIALSSQSIDENMTNNEPLELRLPDELSSSDFEIPIIEDNVIDDNNHEYIEVAACAAEPIGDITDVEETEVKSLTSENLNLLNHSEFSEDITDNIDEHITNQDGVENFDTPELNDL